MWANGRKWGEQPVTAEINAAAVFVVFRVYAVLPHADEAADAATARLDESLSDASVTLEVGDKSRQDALEDDSAACVCDVARRGRADLSLSPLLLGK